MTFCRPVIQRAILIASMMAGYWWPRRERAGAARHRGRIPLAVCCPGVQDVSFFFSPPFVGGVEINGLRRGFRSLAKTPTGLVFPVR